jgi:hypothetical protein
VPSERYQPDRSRPNRSLNGLAGLIPAMATSADGPDLPERAASIGLGWWWLAALLFIVAAVISLGRRRRTDEGRCGDDGVDGPVHGP